MKSATVTHRVEIDRVVIHGAVGVSDPDALRGLVEAAVARALTSTALVNGRSMRASLRVDVGRIEGGAAVAGVVATSVADAARGGGGRG